MKKFFDEFREFAMKGNVVDLAVGVIIGAAFGKIVTSLVTDVIMPPIGILLGGVSFTDLKIILKQATVDASGKAIDAVSLNYGNFLQTVVDFLIVAFTIFAVVKTMNMLRKKKEKKEEAAKARVISNEEALLTEIRDILKEKKS